MSTGLAIRSAITLLALGCVIDVVFLVQPGEFPFGWLVRALAKGEVDLSTVRQRARAVHAGISST
jgi:hypothetical protein